MQGLKERVALVTGAGRGLGRAAALRLAAEGADVAVNDVDEAAAAATAEAVRQCGRRAMVSAHDVGEHAQARELVRQTCAALGAVHVLVNNAGIVRDGMLAKLSEASFDAVLKVNLKGVFSVTQAVVAQMRDQGGRGSIVNIASISYLGNVGQTNYAAAKAGVVGMTRTWALELARYGIRVNAIAPGLMDTDMVRAIPPEVRAKMVSNIPLGRLGRPEELAAAVAFLASEEASFLTGHVLHLDGGSSVGGL